MGIFQLNKETDNSELSELKDKTIDDKTFDEKVSENNDKKEIDTEQEIKLDGPLSSIYAKALNMMYSKESTSMMIIPNNENKVSQDGIYVYCCNGDELDNNSLIESTDKLRLALDNKKYSKVVAVIESNNVVNDKIGLLDNYIHSLGIETYYSRKIAIDKISKYIKK